MSYVDLMGHTRWSEEQHVRRTETILRRDWPQEEEDILKRDFLAAISGRASMTPELQARADAFEAAALASREAGAAARAAAALLHAVLDIEEAAARLSSIPPAPEDPQAEDPHAADREAAAAARQALLDVASPEALQLLADREAARGDQAPADEPTVEPAP